jgi:hypothetical protein
LSSIEERQKPIVLWYEPGLAHCTKAQERSDFHRARDAKFSGEDRSPL